MKRIPFIQNKLFRAIFLGICLVVAIGLVRSVISVAGKRGIVSERKAVLTREEQKKQELLQRLEEATSAAFIEREARNKLGLVREGETVVIMGASAGAGLNNQGQLQGVPSWKQWWALFF